MAKSKSFFGLRRGSTKSMTFQVLKGAQITKDRVSEVKNLRTLSQMQQRMVLATASAAYSSLRTICDHSFEGVSYGQECMAKFISLNSNLLKSNLSAEDSVFAYNPYSDRNLYPGAYQISKGSLPTPSFTQFFIVDGADSFIAISGWENTGSNPTAAVLAEILGIGVGDILTWACIYFDYETNNYKFDFFRLMYVKEGDTALTSDNFSDYFTLEGSLAEPALDINKYEIQIYPKINITDGYPVYKGFIVSKKLNSVWKRSTLILKNDSYVDIEPTAATALATYPIGTDYVLNGGEV